MAKKLLDFKLSEAKETTSVQIKEVRAQDIAIIGMAGYFPDANNLNEFWQNISRGLDSIKQFPELRRRDTDAYLQRFYPGAERDYRVAAYLQEVDKFDYNFFRLSPKEASIIDPNQRLFLQTAYAALEDAGYGGNCLVGSRTGVYVGFGGESSYRNLVKDLLREDLASAFTGNLPAILASRISYYLDFRGPSIIVNTACSSSLVAVHYACQDIRHGECELAIAGSVNLKLLPLQPEGKLGIESADGRARTFDDSSDGTGGGEGVGAVFLKPLSKALADGDHIYAVIKGSAINQDGSSIGITAPNPVAQEDVIIRAWKNAGIDPLSITYLEAHGTGTKLGDPIEIEGIERAFRHFTDHSQFCAIGSVKTNIGHLDNAAGIAGLIKAALALKHQELPPTLHFNKPNARIDFLDSPVYVNDIQRQWESSAGQPLRCGVSAFGLSGTNCHLILEEAPERMSLPERAELQLLTLSAKSKNALLALVQRYVNADFEKFSLADVCYTANTGRGHYQYRLALLVESCAELKAKLAVTALHGLDTYRDDGGVAVETGIYYGEHLIIPAAKKDKAVGEITENTKKDLSIQAGAKAETLISTEVLKDIAVLYVKGAEVPWQKLFPAKRQRVSLPTYPFEPKRCWVKMENSAEPELFYTVSWQQGELPSAEVRHFGGTLIFSAADEMGEELARNLRAVGRDVYIVELGSEFKQVSEKHYTLRSIESDYERLMNELKEKQITQIIHLLVNPEETLTLASLEENQRRGVLSLFYLARAITHTNLQDVVEIVLISDYVNQVTQKEKRLNPASATFFGLGKVISVENVRLKCRAIDIDDSQIMPKLLNELECQPNTYLTAYRDGQRYVEVIERAVLSGESDTLPELSTEGVYVITGGTGGIGLAIAHYLAAEKPVKLALLSRSSFPEREKWEEILRTAKDEKLCLKLTKIQAMEALGAEVGIYQADVTKESALCEVLATLKARYGKITGVIHSAGVAGDGFIINKELHAFRQVLAPKVQGSWLLDMLTADDELDFFILFSSVTTLLATPGQGDYTAANAFLDAFAAYRRSFGKKALTLNWTAWKETGMAHDYGVNQDGLFKALPTAKALKAFAKVLHTDLPQVIIGELNYEREVLSSPTLPINLAKELRSELAGRKNTHQGNSNSERLANTARQIKLKGQVGIYTTTEKQVAFVFAEVLGVEEINLYENFYDLGGDSLIAMRIINRLNQQMALKIEVTDLLTHPTISEFAGWIDKKSGRSENFYSILPVSPKDYYPLSSAQKRMYIINQLAKDSISYNIPGALIIEGLLDEQRLTNAFRQLIKRHETLRTSFVLQNSEPVQRIHAEVDFHLEISEDDEENTARLVDEFIQPFDLANAPLLRVKLVHFAEHRHLLVLDLHHIIADGTSMSILIAELASLYAGKDLAPLKIHYKDYSVWQNQVLASEELKNQAEFWRSTLGGELPSLHLPLDYKRPAIQSFTGDNLHFTLDGELAGGLNSLARETGGTLYMVLLAIYNTLLYKYTGAEDIIVGLPIAGRPHPDLEKIIGMFVNTLALRNYPQGKKSFREFLRTVITNTQLAYANQDYQFEELFERLTLKRDLSRNPLFDTVFVLQNVEPTGLNALDLNFTPYRFPTQIAKFDLTLQAVEGEAGIEFSLEYCTKLFKRESMERLASHFLNVARAVVKNPATVLSLLELMTEEEKRRILLEFNQTKVDYPREKSIPEVFAAELKDNPAKIALVEGEKTLTYQELNDRARKLALILRKEGVKPDTLVAILAKRSIESIVGLLGILQAGGAYLPLDPAYPVERLNLLFQDSCPEILLTESDMLPGLDFRGKVIDIADLSLSADDSLALDYVNTPTDLAYIMYTSGSTGKPKGVLVEQRNVLRLVKNPNYIKFTPHDQILLTGAMVFDASTFEIWGALLNGLTLYLVTEEEILKAERLKEVLARYAITTIWLTSPLFNQLADENPEIFLPLKNLLVGGDVLSVKHINRVKIRCQNLNLINGYGPTENTTFSACHLIEEFYAENIPLGKPISNSTVYILQHNQLQPIGVPGELCVGGDGVARGYLNRPELTAEKFSSDPFNPGGRLYRTGDLARWLPDGNLEFLGRIDNQVKIRGFRVEPAEVEKALSKHSAVREGCVLARDDAEGNKYLTAYYVSSENIAVFELREFLRTSLPEYMLPQYFMQLTKMPLTPNGKIDRKALPEIADVSQRASVAPRTLTEVRLANLWQEVLGVARVGVEDNFFELGGHSLKATVLAARIHREFHVDIPLREIFTRPTIAGLAHYLETAKINPYAAIEPCGVKEFYPVSAAQKRLLALNMLDCSSVGYNIPLAVIIEGFLAKDRLLQAFQQLLNRHEALRTSFAYVDGEPVQIVHPSVDFQIVEMQCAENELEQLIKRFITPFDLTTAPLLRAGLVSFHQSKHLLLFDIHHIIADGTSMGILIQELSKLYTGEELPALRVQYKDFAQWQRNFAQSKRLKDEEVYWLNQFAGEVPVMRLPLDYPRPALRSFTGDSLDFYITEEVTANLRQLARETGSTLFMILLAVYNVLLAKYTNQSDLIIGTAIAGRPHADLEKIVGMFINTLALRNSPDGEKTFLEFLHEVKEKALLAYENQDYQFEELIDKLRLQLDLSRNPLFDTLFVVQNLEMLEINLSGLRLIPYKFDFQIAKFDLMLTVVEHEQDIELNFQYSTQLFKKETIEKMASHYLKILHEAVAKPLQKIAEMELLTAAEEAELMHQLIGKEVALTKEAENSLQADFDF